MLWRLANRRIGSAMSRPRAIVAAIVLAAALAQHARATWSIVLFDDRTGEIGVASATCLTGFDLMQFLPVVRVGVGAGCAQSAVDTSGVNRRVIWNSLQAGESGDQILARLIETDSQYRRRQYGIITAFDEVTYTGVNCGAFADGATGRIGSIRYAVQGNVLTGAPVISAMVQALVQSPPSIPDMLMAAMEAARSMGGDGRCSCDNNNPTACGAPPPMFTKSAHVGFVVVARRGDTDGVCNGNLGCATGSYFLRLNVRNQAAADPDPVYQLRAQFDTWRTAMIGAPDAITSTVALAPPRVSLQSIAPVTMRVCVWDWQGAPATRVQSVQVSHDTGSAAICNIGTPTALGEGVYEVVLTPQARAGTDRLLITVSDGLRSIPLTPSPTLRIADLAADLDHDDDVDLLDLAILLRAFGGGAAGDVDGDGDTDLIDLARLLAALEKR